MQSRVGSRIGVPLGCLLLGCAWLPAQTLQPPAPPTLTKTFAPTLIGLGDSSTLSFTVTNPNAAAPLSGVSFTDTLPAGLLVATPNGVSSTCAGAVTASAGASAVSLAGGTLAAGASCTLAVQVTATAVGTLTNTTGAVTAAESGPGFPATAALTVNSDAYRLNYASNLNLADGVINITNSGASAPATSLANNSYGDICVNVYVYAPDQELAACCTCLVSPNSLHSYPVSFGPGNLLSGSPLGAAAALANIIQTNSVLIKLLATPARGNPSSPNSLYCPNPADSRTGVPIAVTSQGAITGLAPGLVAWGTRAYPTNTGVVNITETPFVPATLSAGELGKLTGECRALQTTSGSQCPGCIVGGLAVPEALAPKLP